MALIAIGVHVILSVTYVKHVQLNRFHSPYRNVIDMDESFQKCLIIRHFIFVHSSFLSYIPVYIVF